MRLTWYGHAAFLLETEHPPRRIIMDPFAPESGYQAINEPADLVTLSHENLRFHSHLASVQGTPAVLQGLTCPPGEQLWEGLPLRAVTVFENVQHEGPNAIIKLTVDGLTVTHMGDCGHALDAATLAAIGQTDVLLALTGGPPTLSLPDLLDVVERLRPAWIVPMHFRTVPLKLNLLPLEAFLTTFAAYPLRRVGAASVTLSRADLPAKPTVLILDHAR
jgi:L-ascorbate metabolism protein UlaG (beta-lactamase superfamily)